jgi:two-component system, chemotaxis family, response regulator Rcp1
MSTPPQPDPENPINDNLFQEAKQLADRVDKQLQEQKENRRSSRDPSSQSGNVMHIDDNEDDRILFAHAFAQAGLDARLHSFPDVTEAFLFLTRMGPYVAAPRPNLIVLDLNLPDLDGRYVLTVLKSSVHLKAIPVVILTGSESYADIQWCRDLHVDDYVVKPKSSRDLVEVIAGFDRWLIANPHPSTESTRPEHRPT